MRGSVVLIGFMGAGKTSIGRALAGLLDMELYDTDEAVEASTGRSIAEIWKDDGEESFRELEHVAVRDAVAAGGRVIACGGGAILQLRNHHLLKSVGPVVYLRAGAKVLRARAGSGSGRPLLADPKAFDRLLAERAPAYEAAADVVVDSGEGSPEDVARTIVELLR